MPQTQVGVLTQIKKPLKVSGLIQKTSTHQPTGNEGGFLALQFIKTGCKNTQVLIASDNTSVVAYINKQGSTRSAELCALNSVTLRARHIPGSLNIIADGLSKRNQIQSTEWSLSPQIF